MVSRPSNAQPGVMASHHSDHSVSGCSPKENLFSQDENHPQSTRHAGNQENIPHARATRKRSKNASPATVCALHEILSPPNGAVAKHSRNAKTKLDGHPSGFVH
jgi:hypothetical protein